MVSISKNIDTLWRIAMVLLTVGLYWLQTNFISRQEFLHEKEGALKQYSEDKKLWWDQLDKVNSCLNNLDVSLRLFQANKGIIEDHESRIRLLESPRRWQQQPPAKPPASVGQN